jgi:hypothetical protein
MDHKAVSSLATYETSLEPIAPAGLTTAFIDGLLEVQEHLMRDAAGRIPIMLPAGVPAEVVQYAMDKGFSVAGAGHVAPVEEEGEDG